MPARPVVATIARIVLAVALVVPAVAVAGGPTVEGELTFALPDLEGREVRSTDARFRGKVLLVDLWATWCPPCLTEIPTLVDLQERLGPQGLVVVAIAFESEEEDEASRRARLQSFVEEHGINYLVLDGRAPLDSDEPLLGVSGIAGLPVEILVDRNGETVEARNGYGYSKRWARKLERKLVALLDAQEPAPAPPPAGASAPAAQASAGEIASEPLWHFDTGG